jgi:hypothetical protein
MAHRLPRQTRDMTNSKERPETDGKPDRTKGASEKAREGLPVRSCNDLTIAEAKKKLNGLPQEELKKIRSYEKNHQNRKTSVDWLDRKTKDSS